MICWTCLCKWDGRTCGCSEGKNTRARADFFKALAEKALNGLLASDCSIAAGDRPALHAAVVDEARAYAEETIRQIASSVESGDLFGERRP